MGGREHQKVTSELNKSKINVSKPAKKKPLVSTAALHSPTLSGGIQ
jgi:hypothetical protein